MDTFQYTNSAMALMRGNMQQRTYDRLKDYSIEISRSTPFFDFRAMTEPMFIGNFSWTVPTLKAKWISHHHARDIGAGVWVTPSDIARDYLALKYPDRRRRITTDQYRACVDDEKSPPLYAQPCKLPNGAVYFDLDSAYWQIVRAVGWDVSYLPQQYVGCNSDMTDFPFRFEKLARNCLVSIGTGKSIKLWTGTELHDIPKQGQFMNHPLWRLVCDVLNGVAYEVIRAGAAYVHTDGYIVEHRKAKQVAEAIAGWGLRFSVRYDGSDGEIRGAGSYRVGSQMSEPYKDSTRKSAISRVYDPKTRWLKPRFRAFAELADKEWSEISRIEEG